MKYLIPCWLLLFAFMQAAYAQQSNDRNYVLSRSYKQAGADVNDVGKVTTQIQYLDGLGRPIQNITVGQSPAGSDLVQPIEYDAVGRQAKQYLPYVAAGNGAYQNGGPGSAVAWYAENSALLKRATPPDPSDVSRPYNETAFEPSPLARPAGLRAPGGRSSSSSAQYLVNTESEIKKYDYSSSGISQNGFYAAGTLTRVKTLDEQQNESNDYTDNQGRLICRQVLTAAQTLATYYVYDNIGQLRSILQPNFQDDGSLTNSAFQYEYDDYGRVATKKIPGSGLVEIVYDSFDRPAMSRNSNQLARGKWGFTKYDALNRPVVTGEISSSGNQATWASTLSTATAHHETRQNGTAAGYSLTQTAPSATEADLLTIAFYDDYTFLMPAGVGFNNLYYAAKNDNVRGQQTGSRARVLGSDGSLGAWLTSTIYYDAEYRVIQTSRELFDLGPGGNGPLAVEIILNKYKYDLAAVLAEKYETILNSGYRNGRTSIFTYDHADRLLSIKEKVSYRSKDKEAYTLAQRYNTLGQLQSKAFHSADGIRFRRRSDYTNNIRGWITNAKTFYKQSAGSNDLPFFHFALDYASGGNYTNGNISSVQWLGKDETALSKGLNFQYDKANRLTGSTGITNYADTEKGISYDKNGNIKTLVRAGAAADNLSYNYNGNQLGSITDNSGNNTGLKSGTSTFEYDGNGNMTRDNTKGSQGAAIAYNLLDLPRTVSLDGKIMTYDYYAAGTKYKYVSDTTTIKYAGAFEFNHLYEVRKIATSEGQVIPSGDSLRFDYFLKDHLGNVRVVYDEKGKIFQTTDYYPFGLSIDRNSPVTTPAARNAVNRYLYNEKELQPGSGYLDYGARMYMPEIGRWGVVDPMTEKNHDLSGYSYAVNNPILYTDPFGLDTVSANTEKPVNQGDVVTFANGTSATQSVGEATVSGQGYNTVSNVATPGSGIRMGTDGGLSTYATTKGSNENFVDPFLLSIDMIYSLNLSGANNGNPNVRGGSGPGAAFGTLGKIGSKLTNTSVYSVAFEMKLASTSYPGIYRGSHFLEANKALEATMMADAQFSNTMSALGVNIPRSAAGSILGKSPANWVWHHNVSAGVMQLAPKNQHTIGSSFWSILHPGGIGGYAIWGK